MAGATKGSTASAALGLSRELIVETALGLIDRSGTQGLSMRSLAQELGVEAMSLYRYVDGREDLLDGVVALLMGYLTSSLDGQLADQWRGSLQTVAYETRRIAVDHPGAFPMVAIRLSAAPWLRPPLRSAEVVNTFLTTLQGHGFTRPQAVDALRSFSSFLLGQLHLESAVRGAERRHAEAGLDRGDATIPQAEGGVALAAAPEVLRLLALLSEDRSEEEYEVSLEVLLDRLGRQLSQ